MPIQRGEVYLVNLNPVQGREQAGHQSHGVMSRQQANRNCARDGRVRESPLDKLV